MEKKQQTSPAGVRHERLRKNQCPQCAAPTSVKGPNPEFIECPKCKHHFHTYPGVK